MIPFEELRIGDTVVNRERLTDDIVRRWKHARFCAHLGGGLAPASVFHIRGVSAAPGSQYVRLALTGWKQELGLTVSEAELERYFLISNKTRPENNFHCFEGVGFGYWFDLAIGLRPNPELVLGPDGAWWDYQKDSDGYALQNGGIYSPSVAKISPGLYYRFFGTAKYNAAVTDGGVWKGAQSGMTGCWWIDYDNMKKVEIFANSHDCSIARAASILLVIPNEWHDCGYVGCGHLRKQMKAFGGEGKPATAFGSLGNRQRDAFGGSTLMSPPHLHVKQYLVPGSPSEISAAFQYVWHKSVVAKGAQII